MQLIRQPKLKKTLSDYQAFCKNILSEFNTPSNLNLRIHIKRLARKTICYSRSIEIHEKLIGAYIEKHHYNALES
ncbi:transposase [Xenorhabdus vietnamensis]|uniref:Transposase n=1 Tax=Xenorhabdus vietnamensis TaxID=351656 RepID=A0A1Y2SKQ1_9GAMM|nr:transposase [Xenorhabdus vietnamensis]